MYDVLEAAAGHAPISAVARVAIRRYLDGADDRQKLVEQFAAFLAGT